MARQPETYTTDTYEIQRALAGAKELRFTLITSVRTNLIGLTADGICYYHLGWGAGWERMPMHEGTSQ